ncbi:hypothetical protein FRC06_005153, partial [Ceratobasidium sp. 370]
MPSVLAQLASKNRRSARPASQQPSSLPALYVLNRNFNDSSRIEALAAYEYEASSRGSSQPASPSDPKPKDKPKKHPYGKPGERPGCIKQPPDIATGTMSDHSSPEPSAITGPQRSNPVLACQHSPRSELEINREDAVKRATAYLGSDASNLPTRLLKKLLNLNKNSEVAEETQAGPMEPEGCSALILAICYATNIFKPPDGGSITFPPAKLPVDGPLDEDTATQSESEPKSIKLGPGDSVSQRQCRPLVPLLSQPPLSPILCPPEDDESDASDSDHSIHAPHARKRPRLTETPWHTPRVACAASILSMTQHPPRHPAPTSSHPTAPHGTRTTPQTHGSGSASSLGSLEPPSTLDLGAVLDWAGRLVAELKRPGVTNDQGAGPSHQAGRISQPEVMFDLVTRVLKTLQPNLAATAPAPEANAWQHLPQPRHTDPVKDDSKILEAEAALKLGKHR